MRSDRKATSKREGPVAWQGPGRGGAKGAILAQVRGGIWRTEPPPSPHPPLPSMPLVHLEASCRWPVAGEADSRDAPQGAVADPGGWSASPRSCCSGRRPCPAWSWLKGSSEGFSARLDSNSTCQRAGPPWGPGRPHPSCDIGRQGSGPSASIQALWEQSRLPASLPRVPPAGHRCPS